MRGLRVKRNIIPCGEGSCDARPNVTIVRHHLMETLHALLRRLMIPTFWRERTSSKGEISPKELATPAPTWVGFFVFSY